MEREPDPRMIELNRERAIRRSQRLGHIPTAQLFFEEQQLLAEGDTEQVIDISAELNSRGGQ